MTRGIDLAQEPGLLEAHPYRSRLVLRECHARDGAAEDALGHCTAPGVNACGVLDDLEANPPHPASTAPR